MKEKKGKQMNRQQRDILKAIINNPNSSQRALSDITGHSLGIVNRSVKELREGGYIDVDMKPMAKAKRLLQINSPRNAIILSAGFGMRMVPINMETTKGLLEIKGEVLIERIIRQLNKAGIQDIYVVVGFMKEQYEYLIDLFQVKLITNPEYAVKNNLHSMKKAAEYLSNTYVIPCDIWCRYSPFSRYELYSWYMVADMNDSESNVRVNRKQELVLSEKRQGGNRMIGIAYISEKEADIVKGRIYKLCDDAGYDKAFWEEALYHDERMIVQAKVVPSEDFVEINTYEQLRALDGDSNQLETSAITVISEAFKVKENEITDITVLKKGMTNRSFLFTCRGKKFIMRIPGEGTEKLINRKKEAEVYRVINDRGICDENIYINPQNGYKITRFIESSRVCDPYNWEDVKKCMDKLRSFHDMNLTVNYKFDLFEQINFYESLWNGEKSAYKDYSETKENAFSLKKYIDAHMGRRSLTHIDAVPDNFLFCINEKGEEEIRLIDWEYAAMQDVHVDLAMFSIYSFYQKEQIDELMRIYFKGICPIDIQIKIYCYIAVCGLLWSNWCEYKRMLGVDFGDYSLRQYRYAKEYYRIVNEMLKDEVLE